MSTESQKNPPNLPNADLVCNNVSQGHQWDTIKNDAPDEAPPAKGKAEQLQDKLQRPELPSGITQSKFESEHARITPADQMSLQIQLSNTDP